MQHGPSPPTSRGPPPRRRGPRRRGTTSLRRRQQPLPLTLTLLILSPQPPPPPKKKKNENSPAAIDDARKWEKACSTAANAISDALSSGKSAPSKQQLVDLISGDRRGGSNFTIGAPLTLVALAGRSIHRGRVEGSHSSLVPVRPAEHSVSLVTARHRWFDAGILESLSGEGHGVEVRLVVPALDDETEARVRVVISPRGGGKEGGTIEQVVLLGSGMDARAWRLPLPEGNAVAWFDLDSSPVCEIKRRELESAGAELVKPKEEEGGEEDPKPRFPLKAASYALVGCDMASGEWVEKLQEAGFDPSKASLFVAEGLIYYLGSKAPEFMRSLQSIAAPGSTLLLDALDEPGVASAVRKAEGKGLQGQFSFGVPADVGDLARFFEGFGFDRLVAADTWTVLRARFQREAPGRTFTKDKPSCGRVEGGIRFIAVSKGR